MMQTYVGSCAKLIRGGTFSAMLDSAKQNFDTASRIIVHMCSVDDYAELSDARQEEHLAAVKQLCRMVSPHFDIEMQQYCIVESAERGMIRVTELLCEHYAYRTNMLLHVMDEYPDVATLKWVMSFVPPYMIRPKCIFNKILNLGRNTSREQQAALLAFMLDQGYTVDRAQYDHRLCLHMSRLGLWLGGYCLVAGCHSHSTKEACEGLCDSHSRMIVSNALYKREMNVDCASLVMHYLRLREG